uniref:Ig-like domain-containing protein n=1 Tax=Fundulus heteroclitus TaxID=8078 RepID=A0A3Q2Q1D3_FUNHE
IKILFPTSLISIKNKKLTNRKKVFSFNEAIPKPSEHMEDMEGKLVKIEGRVTGSQPVSVSWFKDDQEIRSSDKYDISFKSNVAVLCIKSSQVADSGRYTCQASNEAGRASCDVTVGILGGLEVHSGSADVSKECLLRRFQSYGFLREKPVDLQQKKTLQVVKM